MRRALAIFEASYGPDHPSVAIRLNNIATLLYNTNRLAEAEPLMRRALAIFEASYGPDHPETANARAHLAGMTRQPTPPTRAGGLLRALLGKIGLPPRRKDHNP